ncbi:MAG: hypothetical protein KBC91_00410 [Candidatus Omnitrophica bacterium]|nr:hypothetical protein [Candidatus Omnitrophota bacterium]
MKTLLKSGLLGGCIVFLWSALSWMVLPYHAKTLNHFQDEAAVQSVLNTNTLGAGLYVLPHPEPENARLPDALARQAALKRRHQMEYGPFALVVMQPRGTGPLLLLMARGLALKIIAAILMTWLLLQVGPVSYRRRVFFVMVAAMLGAVLVNLEQWNWWAFPDDYVLLQMLDLLTGWFLAGLVMAKIVPSRQ